MRTTTVKTVTCPECCGSGSKRVGTVSAALGLYVFVVCDKCGGKGKIETKD